MMPNCRSLRMRAARQQIAALAVLQLLLLPRSATAQPAPEAASGWTRNAPAIGRSQMVAAANPLAVAAGREVLRKGGTAVDAAIAVQLVLGLVEPQSSGLGGGAFLLHLEATTGKLTSYDGRETAPAAARPDRFLLNGRPMPFQAVVKSPLSIGVPGTARLLEHVHRRHGRLGWADLFAPAIQLAVDGFHISPRLSRLLAQAGSDSFSADARGHFFDAEGHSRPPGFRLVNPEYGRTLAAIAARGADAFYQGEVAERIVAGAAVGAETGKGGITLADLSRYEVVERPPLCTGYRGHAVCTMGPPSSAGHAIGQALMLLEPFDLGSAPAAAMAPGPVHLVGEALKLAFADRNWYLADPAFVPVPAGLLAPGYIAERRRLLSPSRPMAQASPGTPPDLARQALGPDGTTEASGTSHISIVDDRGNAVAMTTTIEAMFGSGRWAAGFLLNNELTDFSFRAAADGRPVANRVEPGKRPRSSMAPTIVLGPDGKPVLVTGSAGGARIIPYVLKTIVGVIDWKLDAAAAVALPNYGFRGGRFELEQPMVGGLAGLRHPAGALGIMATALRLKPYGHEIHLDMLTSGTQLVVRRADGTLEGAADPRREGVALGD